SLIDHIIYSPQVVAFFFQAEDGIRAGHVTGVQTCALPIFNHRLQVLVGHRGVHGELVHYSTSFLAVVRAASSWPDLAFAFSYARSEERRVGKEYRYRMGRVQ